MTNLLRVLYKTFWSVINIAIRHIIILDKVWNRSEKMYKLQYIYYKHVLCKILSKRLNSQLLIIWLVKMKCHLFEVWI